MMMMMMMKSRQRMFTTLAVRQRSVKLANNNTNTKTSSIRAAIHTMDFFPTDDDIDKKLRDDIKHLGKALGTSIKSYDTKVFDTVEELRVLSRQVSINIHTYTYIYIRVYILVFEMIIKLCINTYNIILHK